MPLDPEFQSSLAQFLGGVSAQGIRYRVTSAYRSRAQQAKLYAAWRAGRSRFPAAPPGRSAHEYGLAADIVFAGGVESPMQIVLGLAREAGLKWGGENDPVHFELERVSRPGSWIFAEHAPEEVPLPCASWMEWYLASKKVLTEQYGFTPVQAERYMQDQVNRILRQRPEVAECFQRPLGEQGIPGVGRRFDDSNLPAIVATAASFCQRLASDPSWIQSPLAAAFLSFCSRKP